MIKKAKDAIQKDFHGVSLEVLAHSKNSMVTKMKFVESNDVPFHKHPNEQSGYVVSGKYRLRVGEFDEIIEAGDSYAIPGNIEHALTVIEAGEVIDVFTPPREDYF
tara:strand:+ start:187 stop:504 length:318 start_codon:yes stop_codon:yes gene_type:complete